MPVLSNRNSNKYSPHSQLERNLLIDSFFAHIVESTYLNIDMCKLESSQKDESRTQSADSSKAYKKLVVFTAI